jgi:hypothetical protein
MREWSSAVPLLAIVFASGYMLGRYSPVDPQQQAGRAVSVGGASPTWHGPLPDPRGRWTLPEAGPHEDRLPWSLPPGHPAIPDGGLESPAVDELGNDSIEREIVVLHPREPMRT